jgi:hypothetical protein
MAQSSFIYFTIDTMVALEAQQSQEKLVQLPGMEKMEDNAKKTEYQKAAAKGLEEWYTQVAGNKKENTENNKENTEKKERPPEYLPQGLFINKTKDIIWSPIPDIPENNMNILKEKWIHLYQSKIKEIVENVFNLKEPINDAEKLANEDKVRELQNIVQYFYPIDAKTGEMKKSSMDGDFGPNVGLGIMNMLGISQEKIIQYRTDTKNTITENNAKYGKPPFKRCDEGIENRTVSVN